MLESKYKTDIVNYINQHGGKAIKIVTSEYGRRGEPDIYGSWNGISFVIEGKIFPNKPTQIQEIRLTEWENAGTIALVMQYPHHTPEHLIEFLKFYCSVEGWLDADSTQEAFNDFIVKYNRRQANSKSVETPDRRSKLSS